MLRTKKIALMIIAGLILTVAMAAAQAPAGEKEKCAGCKEEMNKHCHMRGALKHPENKPMIPDLTDEQKDKIETMRLKHMQDMLAVKNEMGEKKARLQTLTTAEKVNMSEINKLVDNIGALHTMMMKMQIQHRQAIRELLTDKQRVTFDAHCPGPGKCMGGKERMHHSEPE